MRPAKKAGTAAGMSTWRSTASLPAPMPRTSATSSRSAEASPSTVLTTMGKKPTSATTMSLDSMPMPTHTMRRGASTSGGTVCEATTMG